jgi:hypothetical protein
MVYLYTVLELRCILAFIYTLIKAYIDMGGGNIGIISYNVS